MSCAISCSPANPKSLSTFQPRPSRGRGSGAILPRRSPPETVKVFGEGRVVRGGTIDAEPKTSRSEKERAREVSGIGSSMPPCWPVSTAALAWLAAIGSEQDGNVGRIIVLYCGAMGSLGPLRGPIRIKEHDVGDWTVVVVFVPSTSSLWNPFAARRTFTHGLEGNHNIGNTLLPSAFHSDGRGALGPAYTSKDPIDVKDTVRLWFIASDLNYTGQFQPRRCLVAPPGPCPSPIG